MTKHSKLKLLLVKLYFNFIDKKEKCKCCGRTKPFDQFYLCRSKKNYLSSYCKKCNRAKSKENYANKIANNNQNEVSKYDKI